jgi:hypothetical protein
VEAPILLPGVLPRLGHRENTAGFRKNVALESNWSRAVNRPALRAIMAFCPQDSSQQDLVTRLLTLHAQRDDEHPHTLEYGRLTAEILELSKTYGSHQRK